MITGAQFGSLNQRFVKQDRLVNNRPLYVSSVFKSFGLWFNGVDQWVVGDINNINRGQLNLGYLYTSSGYTDCPVNSRQWTEALTKNSNFINHKIDISCDGMFIIYL